MRFVVGKVVNYYVIVKDSNNIERRPTCNLTIAFCTHFVVIFKVGKSMGLLEKVGRLNFSLSHLRLAPSFLSPCSPSKSTDFGVS